MELTIGPFVVSDHGKTFVIAEAGVNHNGDPALARRIVTAAKAAGADCVKFQAFRADRLATATAPKAKYQLANTDPRESQLEMLRKLELSPSDYEQIAASCDREGIIFLATPYGFEDVDMLNSLRVEAYKVASGQAVEPLFLEYIARKGKPVILSTGMCTFAEVERAVEIIRNAGNDQIVVMQCTTNYPSPTADANLRAMVTMRDRLGVLVGYSDHTQSLTAATVAVGLGACIIERHFTVDKTLPGPDQSCSSDPDQFAQLVSMVREARQSLGSPDKAPTKAEQQHLPVVRRGIVAATDIAAGSPLTLENLTLMRPVSQLNGEHLPGVLGRFAAVDIQTGASITPAMVR